MSDATNASERGATGATNATGATGGAGRRPVITERRLLTICVVMPLVAVAMVLFAPREGVSLSEGLRTALTFMTAAAVLSMSSIVAVTIALVAYSFRCQARLAELETERLRAEARKAWGKAVDEAFEKAK